MASEKALQQARALMDVADSATDDPRRTRIDLVQVANDIARRARGDDELRRLVEKVSDFLGGQSISADTLKLAVETGHGWPATLTAIEPGPKSYFYAALRLLGHAALRNGSLTTNFEALAGDVAGWTERVQRTLDAWDGGWADALTLTAAQAAAKSDDFRRRLTAAAWDVQQLCTGNELPMWDDFSQGSSEPTWPPLDLGVQPIQGGMDDNERFNGGWDAGTAGAVVGGIAATFAACLAGFGSTGHGGEMVACIVVVVVILIAILVWAFW
jgi:hypothetical protein